jgi:hypothetical protein
MIFQLIDLNQTLFSSSSAIEPVLSKHGSAGPFDAALSSLMF